MFPITEKLFGNIVSLGLKQAEMNLVKVLTKIFILNEENTIVAFVSILVKNIPVF